MPWRLVIFTLMVCASAHAATPNGAGGGAGTSRVKVDHAGGGGYGQRPGTGGPGAGHHMARLNHQYSQTQQAIQMWNQALKSASQNPMDDYRRREVQRTYENVNINVAKLETIAKSGAFDPSVLNDVRKDIASEIDLKAIRERDDKDSGQPDDVGNGRPIVAEASDARLGTGTVAGAEPPRPDIINLTIAGGGAERAPKSESAPASEKESTATAAGTTEGFPLRDGGGKLGELQSLLVQAPEKIATASQTGDVATETSRARKAPAEEIESAITRLGDELVNGESGAGATEESLFDDEPVPLRKRPLLERLFGDAGEGRVLASVIPGVKHAENWGGVNGKAKAKRAHRRHLVEEDDGIDWLVIILKWIVLPSLVGAIIWIAMLLRRVKLGAYSATPER